MRPIDADAVFKWYVETFSEKNLGERAIKPNEIRFSMNDIRENLDNIPTIDAVPVIRCKDCEHFRPFSDDWNGCYNYAITVSPDHFCSSGERRTDETD